MVECPLEPMVLLLAVISCHVGRHMGHLEDTREIQAFSLPVLNTLSHVEQIGAPDHVTHSAYAQCCHDGAELFCDEKEEVHHIFGLPFKFLAQLGVLRCYADRTGVEMAFTHHDAATDHQRRCGESKLISTKDCPDGNIASCLHLAVHLHRYTTAELVQHQCLLGFGQPQFPRRTGMFDGGPWRRSRAAVVSCYCHV